MVLTYAMRGFQTQRNKAMLESMKEPKIAIVTCQKDFATAKQKKYDYGTK
jgi:uncharacterized pyridoxamine 5'-phosphate oxidase family protein